MSYLIMIVGVMISGCAPPPDPTPTPTPAPTLTEMESLERRMALEFVDINWYVSVTDALWFVGVVRNTGAVEVDTVRVDITLMDLEGRIVAENHGYSAYDPVAPGEVTPFTVLFEEGPAWAEYTATADTRPYTSDLHYGDFEASVTEAGSTDFLDYTMTGYVRNVGSSPAQYTGVTVIYYNQLGRVVGLGRGVVDDDILHPDESAPFQVLTSTTAGPVASYDLLVSALRADDEGPIPPAWLTPSPTP